MSTPPAWALDATALAAAFRGRTLDPVAALDSCLARAEATNPVLNAIVTFDIAGARQAAEASAARHRTGAPLGLFDGVPITVKDNLYVGGLRATWGSRLFADHVAPRDDIPVARLRACGAVIIGKTNTPELALSGFTDNAVFGSTGNPWAPNRQPGGSSGGAVAAVAAGMGPVAIATDAGGSLRRPAGHAGVATLKATPGRVPRRWGFPALATDFQVIGPIARSVRDLRAAFDLIGEAHTAPATPARLTILAVSRCGDAPVDPGVRAAFEDALGVLRGLGHAVTEVPAPWDPEEVGALFATIAAVGVARVVAGQAGWEALVTPAIRAQAETGLAMTAPDYLRALDRIGVLRAELRDWIAGVDVLATPSAAVLPWPRDRPGPAMVDGVAVGPRAAALYSTVINLAALPAAVVPSAPVGGLPTGLQLVAGPFREELLLDLAEAYEGARPWQPLAPL
ncbi:amidase [Roseomonas sp. CECT 9278]|uniref:amidase n=1 Tax=Roseomonas sp. CECT 9278 TaxID=2845823 RepID=UPI001E3089D7|nr:amidase [Roseomonas sp. CECT 9278]CAH0161212.1 Acylamidase [Roseomonas sp. CECT 9278]